MSQMPHHPQIDNEIASFLFKNARGFSFARNTVGQEANQLNNAWNQDEPASPGTLLPINSTRSYQSTYQLGFSVCLQIYEECLRLCKKTKSISRTEVVERYLPYIQCLCIGYEGHLWNALPIFTKLAMQTVEKLKSSLVDSDIYLFLDRLCALALDYFSSCIEAPHMEGVRHISERVIPINYSLAESSSLADLLFHEALIDKTVRTVITYETSSFPSFYKALIGLLLNNENNIKQCEACGLPYFPSGSNSRYCDRINKQTLKPCSERFEASGIAGRISARNTGVSISRKSDRARYSVYKKLFKHLGTFVGKTIGPCYQKEILISNELYEQWRSRCAHVGGDGLSMSNFPIFVIWNGKVCNGHDLAVVTDIPTGYSDFLERIKKSAVKTQSHNDASYAVPAYRLIEEVVEFNNEISKTSGPSARNPLPIPGIPTEPSKNYYHLLGEAAIDAGGNTTQHSKADKAISAIDSKIARQNIRYRAATLCSISEMAGPYALINEKARRNRFLKDLENGKVLLSSLFDEHKPLDNLLAQNNIELLITKDPYINADAVREHLRSFDIDTRSQLKKLPARQLRTVFLWLLLAEKSGLKETSSI